MYVPSPYSSISSSIILSCRDAFFSHFKPPFDNEASIQRLNLCWYNYEEAFISIDQVKSPNGSLRNVLQRYCRELLESMRKQGNHYGFGMKIVFFSHDFNASCAMMDYLLATEHGRNVVNDGFNLNSLDGWPQQAVLHIFRKTCEHL